MTIAFDFSVEEMWVPLMAGATLVPGNPGVTLVGNELADYLGIEGSRPLLLPDPARDDREGRARAQDSAGGGRGLPAEPGGPLASRRADASSIAYGPTEATVTATLTELTPDKPVTIGGRCRPIRSSFSIRHKDQACTRGSSERSASPASGWRRAT